MLFKNIIIASWMASLLLSTAGVSIHRVYCFCTKKAVTSAYFSPKDGCGNSAAADNFDCCKKAETVKSCCEKTTVGCEKKQKCTDRTTAFAKLDVKFLQSDFSPQLPDPEHSGWVAVVSAPVFFEINFSAPPEILLPGNKAPPFGPSGRALRNLICSFQC